MSLFVLMSATPQQIFDGEACGAGTLGCECYGCYSYCGNGCGCCGCTTCGEGNPGSSDSEDEEEKEKEK